MKLGNKFQTKINIQIRVRESSIVRRMGTRIACAEVLEADRFKRMDMDLFLVLSKKNMGLFI